MAKLVRKNLMVDEEKLKELARRRGLSESAAVREAVAHALAAEIAVEVFSELQARGGVDDVFGILPAEDEEAAQQSPAASFAGA